MDSSSIKPKKPNKTMNEIFSNFKCKKPYLNIDKRILNMKTLNFKEFQNSTEES